MVHLARAQAASESGPIPPVWHPLASNYLHTWQRSTTATRYGVTGNVTLPTVMQWRDTMGTQTRKREFRKVWIGSILPRSNGSNRWARLPSATHTCLRQHWPDWQRRKGWRFVEGNVEAIEYSSKRDKVQSLKYRDKQSGGEYRLDATDVILAAGPWTQSLLPEAPIVGGKSHSVVIETGRVVSPTIIFFDPGRIAPGDERNQLEVYPRPDKTVYMCGRTNYGAPLPATTDDVDVNPKLCQELMENLAIVSSDLAQSQVLISQACFRPIVNLEGRDPELGPLLGFTGIKGLVLAAGHNQWGIHNSPITGKIISELVFDGRPVSADITELDPRGCLKLK